MGHDGRGNLVHGPRSRGAAKLVVRPSKLVAQDGILGDGQDVLRLPEGHLVCSKCAGHAFECWMYGDEYRIEMGCIKCSASYRLNFPRQVNVGKHYGWGKKHDRIGQGRFTCTKHPDKGMILIHNIDVISIGCEKCRTELNVCLRKARGIIIDDGK